MKRQIILTLNDDESWSIDETRPPDSVYPVIIKPIAREMVARLMQLVDVGPVAPQTVPERIEISGDVLGG